MPEQQLRQLPLRNSTIDLYIANYSGATSGTSFGFNQIDASRSYLLSKAQNQLGSVYSDFAADFVNYDKGIILCVNTSNLLNKTEYTTSNAFSDSLRFTVVKMPGDFSKIDKSKLSSPYEYGERLRISASFEKSSSQDTRKKSLVYRDTNIKGRSRAGQQSTGGVGIGVWS